MITTYAKLIDGDQFEIRICFLIPGTPDYCKPIDARILLFESQDYGVHSTCSSVFGEDTLKPRM